MENFSCNDPTSNPIDIDGFIRYMLLLLTLEEKISMVHGTSLFSTGGVSRLGIPAMRMSDGPCGVREEMLADNWNTAGYSDDDGIYLPALTALSSSWNRDLAEKFGDVLGKEARIRGKHILLAPGINLIRSPLNGRNWEYMSEDPFLISALVIPIIKGIQENGVAACVKHFALNNQETCRETINVLVSERSLRELYLPGFESAVIAGKVLAVMCSYNKIGGEYASANRMLLEDILKKEWGFKGVVISDWNAVHNMKDAALNGLDIEMGTAKAFDHYYFAAELYKAIKSGEISELVLNEKVLRILYVMVQLGILNEKHFSPNNMRQKLASIDSCAIAKQIACESIVLLKNDHQILPLDINKISSIGVIGDNAVRLHALGGGSTTVRARYEITPLEGLRKFLPERICIHFAQGYQASEKVQYNMTVAGRKLMQDAIEVARNSDVILFFGGLNHLPGLECEGVDRSSMKLPYGQDRLINALYKANKNLVVVMLAGSPLEFGSWLEYVPSLIQHSYLGMEAGNALSEMIFGNFSPSGRLPFTIPVQLKDSPSHKPGEFPGKNGKVHYKEGIYVGYRYFNSKGKVPRYSFGYGLSYSEFTYRSFTFPSMIGIQDERFSISFELGNIGEYTAMEVVQLYIQDKECCLDRPEKELKAFEKVLLKPGENKIIEFSISQKDLSYFDPSRGSWICEPGLFLILIGSSNNDIRLQGEVMLS